MQSQKLSLDKKLFLQKQTVAVMTSTNTDVVQAPQAVSAPFHTALSTASPLRCYPCCQQGVTIAGCYN
ncbi:hypothetical protein [Chitinophaga sp. HK235]|uniref:hypothetical protein n=1 Tax=Chitinophaga sp. HK235 TaxID=2952571 RepID=UPI001BABFB01|nr:hypothetical protein [Chitinophaga sp. HK235]